jgi:hypothetical protein
MNLNQINNAVILWGAASAEGIEYAVKSGDLCITAENRPGLIGLKHNIPLLQKKNIRYCYCSDNTLGLLFYKRKIKETIIFYKENHDQGIVAVCGSLYVLLLSRIHGVKVTVFSQGKVTVDLPDTSAATLNGKSFVVSEDKPYVMVGNDEFIEWKEIEEESSKD